MSERAPTFEAILPRLDDPKRPFRFKMEQVALNTLHNLVLQGQYPRVDFSTILQVYDRYLSDQGF